MAVNLPLASEDPYLLNLDAPPIAVDPNLDPSTQSNPLDAGAVPASGDTGVSSPVLSGDNYAPQPAQADTTAPSPIAQQGFDPSWVGKNIKDIPSLQNMQQGYNPSWIGRNISDIRAEQMPQAQAASPLAAPIPKYGNDIAGNILSSEYNLTNDQGTQAFIHGAQSQALPLAGAIGGGFLGGMAAGALIGSAVPGFGTIVGGLIGGLIGYMIADQVQGAIGPSIASKQTMDALNEQTKYEQQNYPVQYGIGQLVPQLVGFHPSATAFVDSFKLIGRVAAIPSVTAKLAELRLPENHAALNQIVMMAWGTGQTGYQAQQEISQGNVQPGLLALNLIGSTLFTQPNKWVGRLIPALREPVLAQRDTALQGMTDSHNSTMDEYAQLLSSDPEAVTMTRDQKQRFEQIRDLANNGKDPSSVVDEYNRVSLILDQRLQANTAEPPKPIEATPEPVTPQAQPEVPGEQPVEQPAQLTGEQAQASVRASNQSVQPDTTRLLQMTTPEPTGKTTPEGVSVGIRNAVLHNSAADAAFNVLHSLGDVHVVGGAVRNMVAGKPIKDLDLTFSGTEQQLTQALETIGDAQVQKTGEQFPVYRLTLDDGNQVEIALHRTENPENQNAFATGENIPIHEDLGRRDFTANAMGVNIRTGEFVDPFNGLKHTQSRSLSLVNPRAFAGDPVRMLRALRFIGDGYHANKSLLTSMKENAALLGSIPPERIQAELDRIFSSEKPGKALEAMKETGVLDHIFPEHLKTIGFDQRSTHHNQLLWDHIMGVVNKVAELNPDPDVRMAAFLHDISKPATITERPDGRASYLGHEDKGAEVAQRILKSFRYSNDRIDRIVFLVKNHMFQQPRVLAHPAGFIHDMSKDLMSIPVEERKAIVDQRVQDLFDIRQADQANHPVNKADIKGMRTALESVGQKLIGRPANNIDGNDLIELGLKPGPEFSRILKQLDHEVAEGDLTNEPETLLTRAKELAGIKPVSLQARRLVPFDQDPWPQVRKAILDDGGIGPSPDWPRDWIPGDLFRVDGKKPDLVAAQTTIGRADVPPWGDNQSDSDMMTYLRNAFEQHQKIQQGRGSFQPQDYSAQRAPGVREPNLDVRDLATQYTQSVGLRAPTETEPVRVNPAKAARLAKFYEEAHSDPGNPEVQAAYRAFNAETEAQWKMAVGAGYRFEPWDQPGQPYRNSAEMRADVLYNKHLYFFKTSEGQTPHELMTSEQNDKFRAVHDLFGHAMNGNEFGPNGEENAWVEHGKMYSPLAQKAMTTETRAQNSTVNFGTNGDFNRANPGKTIYPQQKAVVPPGEFLPGQPTTLTHYSAKARTEISPEHQGDSGLSSELARTGPNQNKAARYSSYYEQGVPHERFFGLGTAFPVKHTVNGDYKILDLNSPEAHRIQREAMAKNQYGVMVAHEVDDAIQEAGYDGYKRNGTVRLFGKQPVSHINDIPVTPQEGQTDFTARLGQGQTLQAKNLGEQNGIQQETAGQPEASRQAGVSGQTGLGTETGNAGQVGGQEPTGTTSGNEIGGTPNEVNGPTQGPTALNFGSGLEGQYGGSATSTLRPPPIGTGNIRTNAGDAARAAGATDVSATGRTNAFGTSAPANAASGFSATARATRDRQAAQLGSTNAEQSAKTGNAGWSSSSDVEDQFIQDARALAESFGVDLSQAPQFRGGIRLTPDEHQELIAFSGKPNNETNQGNAPLRKAALFIPDDPSLVPVAHMPNAKDWPTLMNANKLVDQIRLHEKGNPTLEYLPAKITDDASRVALILKGWEQRGFYDNARTFPDSIVFEGAKPGAKERWRASQPTFGDRASVKINARNVIAHHSRMEAGVFRNYVTGEEFDPKHFQALTDAGLIKSYSRTGDSVENITRASRGLLPESQKVGDFAGAMAGEARAPVDLWRARLAYGKENTPTTKMYEYEFGRNNFLTRMFSAYDPNILPSHVQSAEWFGYQQLVSERLASIKAAAIATGDPDIIRMAKGIRSNLESKDLAEVFRDYYGLTAGAKPPVLPFDKILANPRYRDSLIAISHELFNRRFLKGKLGLPTSVGGRKDILDIQEGRGAWRYGNTQGLLSKVPELRRDLANYYKTYFVDSKTVRSGPDHVRQSLDRNVGPIAEAIMKAAYSIVYPNDVAKLGEAALQLAGLTTVPRGELEHEAGHSHFRLGSLPDQLAQPLADLHEQFGLPRGLVGAKVVYSPGEFFAEYTSEMPNQITVNARTFDYLDLIRNQLAPLLEMELKRPDMKDLKGYALAKVKKVIAGYKTGSEESIAKLLLGHELGHAIQDRIYPELLNFSANDPDYRMVSAANTLLSRMTEKYMVGLVREGMGSELESLLQAHSSSLNEYLGGVKGAPAKETMPLTDAILAIVEHQTHQWSQFMKLPHAEYSWATPQTFRNNVYEPEIAEANVRELGKIWQKAIQELNDSLAVEAESQLSGRGPNPAIDSELPSTDETSAGITAYARLPEGNAFQSGTSGWFDSTATDQNVTAKLLTHGERMLNIKATADALRERMASPVYKPVDGDRETLADLDAKVDELRTAIQGPPRIYHWPVLDTRLNTAELPWLQKSTAQAAARIQRQEGEGDKAFAERVVRASGDYPTADHALEVAKAARDGVWLPVKYGDKVGFKIDNKFHLGTPQDHVTNWASGFHDAVHSVLDNLPDHALAGEPIPESPTPDGDLGQLRMAFQDTYKPPVPSARVGAASITGKGGEEIPIPSMKAHDFRMLGKLIPTRQLVAKGGSGNAANMVKGAFDYVQESLDFSAALADQGIFDPEAVVAENERLAGEGGGLPPPRPPLGGGGNGEEPPIGGGGRPPKGQSPEEKQLDAQKAALLRSSQVLRDYLSALKDSLLLEDPAHRALTGNINDLVAQAAHSFDVREWYKDSRNYIKDASNARHAFAMQYQKTAGDIQDRVVALEAKNPGANDRIRHVIHAKGDTERQGLLDGMSSEEAALANHLYHYWQFMGDILKRAGVIKTALENYFPLMVEKTPEGKNVLGGKPGEAPEGTGAQNEGFRGRKFTAKTMHAISRLEDEDGHLLFESPEELQAWANEPHKDAPLGLGWKVKTNVADIFQAQGRSVTTALLMRHAVDQLSKNFEAQIGRPGEYAPPILTQKRMKGNAIAFENMKDYVKTSQMIGSWKSALMHRPFPGATPEDMWIHKPLAEMMEREASPSELPDTIVNNVARQISRLNGGFKQYKFFFTPVHGYSMLGNISTHTGFNPLRVASIIRNGHDIIHGPNRRRWAELLRAGGVEDPGKLGGPAALLQKVPGAGPLFEKYHDLIWKTINYEGTFGLADKLSKDYLTSWAAKNAGEEMTPDVRFDADKYGMTKAKEALGNLENLDMSKNWKLWGNVMFLANRWTTSQLRTLGEAFGIKALSGIGSPVPLEGHSQAATDFMQKQAINASRRLVFGGMLRLAITSTILSTAISALYNKGVPSTPWQNAQKDPGRIFDIYTGRDPVTNRDTWIHMPFYLFQREMLDWVMAGVKANTEGKDFVDVNHLGDSVLAAPFIRFTSKMDPVTKTSLELMTGTEISAWLSNYNKPAIDEDTAITNLHKSLDMLGAPNAGSLENRFLYGWRSLFPGFGFPQNMKTSTADYGAVADALGLGVQNLLWQAIGSRTEQGTSYEMGPGGKMVPTWQLIKQSEDKAAVGQQILAIALTLGTGTPDQERQKMEQMETLRQQANFTPGQLTQLLLYRAGQATGLDSLLTANLAPDTTPKTIQPTQIGGVTLTPQQEVNYESVQFQKEALAMEQALSDPAWKTMDYSQRQAALANLKSFADRITKEQFAIALGTKKGPILTTVQANAMLGDFGIIKKQAQNALLSSATYAAASSEDQTVMLNDRISASENAAWEKYYGGTMTMKGASDSTLASYVALQGGLRDEVRTLIEKLPSFTRSNDPAAQAQELSLALKFADNLVNQAIQGKSPRTFDSPLTQTQLMVAVRNGVVLQDAALKQLHGSFIYQEAPQADQLLLDQKYVNLAHNIALYDTRMGVQEGGIGDNAQFNAILSTTLQADEGYQTLVEQFFGTGGRVVLAQRQAELADLKARFRQEYDVAPQDLARYDTLINRWYEQQNPDYAAFLYYRAQWERYDPLGQAYRATIQSNYGFEADNPLALASA